MLLSRPIHLAGVLEHIVSPVLQSMLRAQELDMIELVSTPSPNGGAIALHLRACDEEFTWFVIVPGQDPETVEDARTRLASELQDFIAESAFAWGQLRPTP